MKRSKNIFLRTLLASITAAILLTFLAPPGARAGTLYWTCVNNWWSDGSCWSYTEGGPGGAGQPQNLDYVYLTKDDITDRTISYRNTAYPAAVLYKLTIDNEDAGTMTLSQSQDNLSAYFEYIGHDGTGAFIQSGGTNNVVHDALISSSSGRLYLGYNTGSSGTYDLSSAGALSADYEYIGYKGTGTFTQSGGTNDVTYNLYLGGSEYAADAFSLDGTYNPSWHGDGTYNLLGGDLSAGYEYIGRFGDGTFTQSGGTNTVANDLYVGFYGDTTGTYTQSGGTNTITGTLYLGYASIGAYHSSGTYDLSGDATVTLSADWEYIGYDDTGEFTQSGGTNTVANDLYVGYNYGSSGTYTQSGGTNDVTYDLYLGASSNSSGTYTLSGGTLTVGGDIVESPGIGIFNVDGGTLTVTGGDIGVNNFNVGYGAGTNGSHTLGGTDTISAHKEYIGYDGTGTFTQSGGTNTVVNDLYLGYNSDSSGTYKLINGDLSTYREYIGYSGTGTFTQQGGTNTITGTPLGYGGWLFFGNGTYNLQGGILDVDNDIVNGSGNGTLNIDGGTLIVGGDIDVDNFNLGFGGGLANGSYTLGAGQSLTAGREILGNFGTGTFTQTGGTNTVTNNLYLGRYGGGYGTYNLNGGTLNIQTDILNGAGTGILNIDGGTLTMLGGGAIDVDDFRVGYGAGTTGSHTLTGADTISANWENIGFNGAGTFTQTGGTNDLTSGLAIGYNSDSIGTYDLSGGDLSANREYIGYYATGEYNARGELLQAGGTFTHTGGTNTVANTLTIAVMAGSTGAYDLQGGTLTVENIGGTAEIINNDTFNYSGGTLNVDTFTNTAAFNLSGVGTRTVNGDVTNTMTGTVKTTGTTAVFTGAFTNLGAYISDPSDNYFTDLVIGETGYLVGGLGDSFFVSGNFKNSSTMNRDWNTAEAYLGFTGTDASHKLSLTGDDVGGADLSGYTDNFAWGTLALETGNFLTLLDGNSTDRGALYLGEIVGLTLTRDRLSIYNISTDEYGLNVYYMASLAANDYLGGLDYDLSGTGDGRLIAISEYTSVPEPSTLLLLGSGLVALGLVRRRLRR